MANITGKTISELTQLTGITSDTLFPVELSGATYHIPYSSITTNLTSTTIILESEILSIGSSPVTILPTPDPNTYYKVLYYDIEFTGERYTNLTFANYLEISQSGIPSVGINRVLIGYPGFGPTSANNYLRVFPGTGLYSDPSLYVQPNDLSQDGKITIKMAKTSSPFFTDPKGGGGVLKITTTYEIKTFDF